MVDQKSSCTWLELILMGFSDYIDTAKVRTYEAPIFSFALRISIRYVCDADTHGYFTDMYQ